MCQYKPLNLGQEEVFPKSLNLTPKRLCQDTEGAMSRKGSQGPRESNRTEPLYTFETTTAGKLGCRCLSIRQNTT